MTDMDRVACAIAKAYGEPSWEDIPDAAPNQPIMDKATYREMAQAAIDAMEQERT